MKKLLVLVAIILFYVPTICFAEAGDHEKSEQLKVLYNKVYPKTKTVGNFTTLRRYKNSTVYYNTQKYPIGPPKHVKDIGNYQLYKRELRKRKCRNKYRRRIK